MSRFLEVVDKTSINEVLHDSNRGTRYLQHSDPVEETGNGIVGKQSL